ncbi:hypothetical protein EV2_024206 [Malus domestica]
MRLALSRAGMKYSGTIGTYCCYNLKRIKMLFLSVAEPELRQYHRYWLRARQCSLSTFPEFCGIMGGSIGQMQTSVQQK